MGRQSVSQPLTLIPGLLNSVITAFQCCLQFGLLRGGGGGGGGVGGVSAAANELALPH